MSEPTDKLPGEKSYLEVLEYLYSQLPMFHRIGPAAYKPGLDNTIALCAMVGNPQKQLKSVHIAGTNGKGSTSHLIASVLQDAGYKTGLYTSPHLKDFRERIRINGMMIPPIEVVEFVNEFKEKWASLQPSFFEITVALAFWYFQKEKADISVIETGLGGRLDSTNVINPEVSIITRIGLDHMNLLGDSIEKIATEKAGIIKRGSPAVFAIMPQQALEICIARAKELGVDYKLVNETDELLNSPLKGDYQQENQRTAAQAIESLVQRGWKIRRSNLINGFAQVVDQTGLLGRWQVLGNQPYTVVDVAHNEDGIEAVVRQTRSIPFEQLHLVLGMVSDKDIAKVLSLLPVEARYYFCKANIPRGMDAQELSDQASIFGIKGRVYNSVKEAFEDARKSASPKDMILVTGSFFTVAEVL